jgi:hypothetical protein
LPPTLALPMKIELLVAAALQRLALPHNRPNGPPLVATALQRSEKTCLFSAYAIDKKR